MAASFVCMHAPPPFSLQVDDAAACGTPRAAARPPPAPQPTSSSIADAAPEPSSSHLPTATTQPVTTLSRDVDSSQITEEDVRVKAETLDKAPTTIEP